MSTTITLTTVIRYADDTTAKITITRGEADCSWGVVDPAYTGRRCSLCDMPHVAEGLCNWHRWQRRQTITKENDGLSKSSRR